MTPLKINNCVATIEYTRYVGSAFILPQSSFSTCVDNSVEHLWCLFQYTGTRTAENDWNDFGPVDHITSKLRPGFLQGNGLKGIFLLKPDTWFWFDEKGTPT